MANPASVGVTNGRGAVIKVTSTEDDIVLDPDREYSCAHDGESDDGTANTENIYLSHAAGITADQSEGADKVKLTDRRAVVVGPGESALYFVTETNDATFTIVPSSHLRGNF